MLFQLLPGRVVKFERRVGVDIADKIYEPLEVRVVLEVERASYALDLRVYLFDEKGVLDLKAADACPYAQSVGVCEE
jgi:hypothetical protein